MKIFGLDQQLKDKDLKISSQAKEFENLTISHNYLINKFSKKEEEVEKTKN